MWCIINVKHPYKEGNILNYYACPVDADDHENMPFLLYMGIWLDAWSNLSLLQCHREGFLTKDIFLILHHTLKILKDVAKYLLKNLNFDFVFYGKFQTDKVESQFGHCHQMCSCNRLVSVQEIKESEGKLKINSLLRLHSLSFTILMKKYSWKFSDSVESTLLSKGNQNFIEEF